MAIADTAAPTLEWGGGNQTLVFLHYFGGAAMSWQWVAAQMQDYRCVAINLPGFGGAPALEPPSLKGYANAVSEEVARLNIEDYTLVGHSMGGKIALQVAISSDRPPQHVVLIAPSPPSQEPMPDEEKERLLSNHPSQDNAKTTVANATHQPLNKDQQALAIKTHMAVSETAWRWWLLEGMNHSLVDQLPQLRVPVTVFASKDDPVISFETIQSDVLGIIPGANLIATQGVGHLLPLEAADWVADRLRQIA
ncbi:alpha/beta hydrolase [Pseudanabaena sp. FACHB-2040]|uniref:alpha/beta fold hydrolase n=1 Tax=Pseudanabaena sp. FACHB-2040 TaxID=2692859 RepID=UPI00168680B3|nr:alpha/beta hydrolase [Pseudanabaena sp. FACHB-2040]MBD2256118.1 alpha/beta hydrolase [Pseudanabaena sp. FACHB-2040]